MKYAILNNGQKFPMLGLGTSGARGDNVYQAAREAIQIGYRHFDTAAFYGNEIPLGKALNDAMTAGEVKREDLWITSKLWNSFHEPEHIEAACRSSLQDLNLDYLDLYLIHWPVAFKHRVGLNDANCGDDFIAETELPLEKTWAGMEKLVRNDLVKSIGLSNYSAKKIDRILNHARIKPAVNQVESHPYLSQTDLLHYCKDNNIVFTAYAPLGSSGRPEAHKVNGEPQPLLNEKVISIAESNNATPAQVMIAWQLQRGAAVIPKSTNPKRLQENFEALNLQLSRDDMKTIEDINTNYRFFDATFWEYEGSNHSAKEMWA